AFLEGNHDRLDFVGRVWRPRRHAEFDQLDAVDVQVFKLAGFVADMQAVLVTAVGLGNRRLDRDLLLVAERDHLAATGKPLAEFFDSPRRDNPDRRTERLVGELKAALIVPFAGSSVSGGVGADFAGDLRAAFAGQSRGDARA